jgi:non-ribosomal peptide synthetase component F
VVELSWSEGRKVVKWEWAGNTPLCRKRSMDMILSILQQILTAAGTPRVGPSRPSGPASRQSKMGVPSFPCRIPENGDGTHRSKNAVDSDGGGSQQLMSIAKSGLSNSH